MNRFTHYWKSLNTLVEDELREEEKSFGIEGAGEVPESLLAAQDLEEETIKSQEDKKKLEDLKNALQSAIRSSDDKEYIDELKSEMQKLSSKTNKSSDGRLKASEDVKYYSTHGVTAENAVKRVCDKYGIDKWEGEEIVSKIYSRMKKSADVITETQKDLEEIKEKSEEIETKKEKKELVSDMKETQKERQEAALSERMKKSFKDTWKEIFNNR